MRHYFHSLQLFVSSAGLSECNSRVSNITFSDRAQNTILDHSYRLPISGTFRPAETLASSFIGKAVDGQWTLAIHESLLDSNPGRLLDWNIHFDLDYCSDGILWSKLSTKSNSCDRASVVEGKIVSQCPESCQRHKHVNVDKDLFTPRYLHSSVAVGNNVYVMGGYAHNHIHEMWRFDYESKFWIKLHGVRERPQWYGRSAVLSPFGMITFGGLKTGNGQSRLESAVLLHNLLNGTKSELKVESSSGVPQSRYLSAAVFIGWDHLLIDFSKVEDLQKIYSYIEPVILFFGGDIDLPNNNYLEDLWLLILKDVDLMTHNNVNLGLHDVCRPMLTPDKTDNNPWDWSCGSLANKNSRNPCRWEDVVLMAWCRGQYQSFFSPE